MKERIFLVGDDPVLIKTRVCMLEDWQTTTANTREAEAAIKAQAFDLLIIGQTVPDETAKDRSSAWTAGKAGTCGRRTVTSPA